MSENDRGEMSWPAHVSGQIARARGGRRRIRDSRWGDSSCLRPLFDSEKVRRILVRRHEQGAGHAAEGYATATGRSGCAWQPLAPAQPISSRLSPTHIWTPFRLLAITGQVVAQRSAPCTFQEADIRGITMPITKHSYLITKPGDIAAAIAAAFHIAGTGRPGPVLVDITKDALQAKTRFEWPRQLDLPGIPSGESPAQQAGAGGRPAHCRITPTGVVRRWRRGELVPGPSSRTRRADWHTGDHHFDGARGLPRQSPQNMGMPGCTARWPQLGIAAQRSADRARHPLRRPGDRPALHVCPLAKVIHADIDPAEISENRVADVPIVGDCKEVISS